jgi:hypothetical protein
MDNDTPTQNISNMSKYINKLEYLLFQSIKQQSRFRRNVKNKLKK